MEKLVINGGHRLAGRVKISGAKNAVLPIIAATLLGQEQPSRLDEVPALDDVHTIAEVLRELGVAADYDASEHQFTVDSSNIVQWEAPYDLVRKMRASFLIMGPLLARCGRAKISLPGGCAIGTRPIDLHLKGFEALGAEIEIGHGFIDANAPHGLKGARIYLDFPSVGATENILMAASMAEGQTILENPAQEPEIIDLANFLNVMGAKIRGAGTNVIKIEGVPKLKGASYAVIPDRIEAGTYMVAAAMTKGDVYIESGGRHRGGCGRRPRVLRPSDESGRREDDALSGIPDRYAGAVHGDDRHLGRYRPRDGDGVREPLHARRRIEAHGREYQD